MSGLVTLILLGPTSLGLLWAMGLRRPAWTLAAAALMFGGAGYALQGRPDLPGSPSSLSDISPPIPLTGARHAFFGQFTSAERWFILADALASRGNTEEAVGAMRAGLKAQPDNFMLWVGLGNTLTDHARMITPAAELAYARAKQLAPSSPAPGFFRGLALMRSGERDAALEEWRLVLANAPAEASWRAMVEDGVALLEGSARPPRT